MYTIYSLNHRIKLFIIITTLFNCGKVGMVPKKMFGDKINKLIASNFKRTLSYKPTSANPCNVYPKVNTYNFSTIRNNKFSLPFSNTKYSYNNQRNFRNFFFVSGLLGLSAFGYRYNKLKINEENFQKPEPFHTHIQLNMRVNRFERDDARYRFPLILEKLFEISPGSLCLQEGLNEEKYIELILQESAKNGYICIIDKYYANQPKARKDGKPLCFLATLLKKEVFDESSILNSSYRDDNTDTIQTVNATRKNGLVMEFTNFHASTRTAEQKTFCEKGLPNALKNNSFKNFLNPKKKISFIGGDANLFNNIVQNFDGIVFTRSYYLNKVMEAVKTTYPYMKYFSIPSEKVLFFNSKKNVTCTFRVVKGDLKEKIIREKLDLLNSDKSLTEKIKVETLSIIYDLVESAIIDYQFMRKYDYESRIKRLKSKINLLKLHKELKKLNNENIKVFLNLVEDLLSNKIIDIKDKDIECALIILDQLYNLISQNHDTAPIDLTIIASNIPIKVKAWVKRNMNFLSSKKYFSNYTDPKIREKEEKEHSFYHILMKGKQDSEITADLNEIPTSDHLILIYALFLRE